MSALMRRAYQSVRDKMPVLGELIGIRKEIIALRADLAVALSALQNMQSIEAHEAAKMRACSNDPRRLIPYGVKVNSQNAEDGMIAEIFRRIGTTDKTFLEIGVGEGVENNTAFLLAQGWHGFWIDGNDSFVPLVKERGLDREPARLRYLVGFVTRENIAGLLKGLKVPAEFDLLSLDVDQNTYYIWEGMSDFRPRVIVVEYNGSIPPSVPWKARYDPARVWDSTINTNVGLKCFELLGKEYGYSLVGCDWMGCNAFFVRNDLVGDLFAAPFTAENHYEPPRYPAFASYRGHPASMLDIPDVER